MDDFQLLSMEMRLAHLLLLLAATGLPACRGADLSPAAGPQFGYFRVRATPPRAVDPRKPPAVRVGGRAAFDVSPSPDGSTVDFTVQGEAAPGPQVVTLTDAAGAQVLSDPLTYQAPSHPAFRKVVAFGASLTQGIQSAGISQDSQLNSPAVQLVGQTGAFFPLALLRRGLLDGVRLSDFNDRCELDVSIETLVSRRATDEALPRISRKGEVQIALARVDPAVEAQNVAIGGSTVSHVLRGPLGGNPLQAVMEHATWDLVEGLEPLLGVPAKHQLDRVVDLAPSLLITVDLLDNDLISGIDLGGSTMPDLDKTVPLEALAADLEALFLRIDPLGAVVLAGNIPPLDLTRDVGLKLERLRQKGVPAAEIDAWHQRVVDHIARANLLLVAQAKKRSYLHVVDLNRDIGQVLRSGGLQVGGEQLSTRPFGGLMSLDNFHFTNTGYAVVANVFLAELNRALGLRLPEVNTAAVLAIDPLSPGAIARSGLACAATAR